MRETEIKDILLWLERFASELRHGFDGDTRISEVRLGSECLRSAKCCANDISVLIRLSEAPHE